MAYPYSKPKKLSELVNCNKAYDEWERDKWWVLGSKYMDSRAEAFAFARERYPGLLDDENAVQESSGDF